MEKLVEVVLTTHGNVGFSSRKIGRTVDTEPCILNTALYYAFGLARGQYIDVVQKPTYVDDTADIADDVYITPATPYEQQSPTYFTSNRSARTDDYIEKNYKGQDDPDSGKNIPKFEAERRFQPGNTFRCFIAAKTDHGCDLIQHLPRYIRLGKKRGKVKATYNEIEFTMQTGSFPVTHPIPIYDHLGYPSGDVIVKNMKPTPLIYQGTLDGDFITAEPTEDETVHLPAEPTFLKQKRDE